MKSGVIALRANRDVIPSDTDRIISVGTSGGGQMGSIFGASGNMLEYYERLYAAGALGVTKNDDGTYLSAFPGATGAEPPTSARLLAWAITSIWRCGLSDWTRIIILSGIRRTAVKRELPRVRLLTGFMKSARKRIFSRSRNV